MPDMSDMLPFSQAAENNKEPIAEILATAFKDIGHVLEIGSCTGQHAVHMARALPHLIWQPSDVAPMLVDLGARIAAEAPENVRPPLALDVTEDVWPLGQTEAVFSANVVHIISQSHIEAMFRGIGRVLGEGGLLCLYGPFKYDGAFTSESNARFELWLKNRDPRSGVRDFEYIDGLARAQDLKFKQDTDMPANNQLILWQKS